MKSERRIELPNVTCWWLLGLVLLACCTLNEPSAAAEAVEKVETAKKEDLEQDEQEITVDEQQSDMQCIQGWFCSADKETLGCSLLASSLKVKDFTRFNCCEIISNKCDQSSACEFTQLCPSTNMTCPQPAGGECEKTGCDKDHQPAPMATLDVLDPTDYREAGKWIRDHLFANGSGGNGDGGGDDDEEEEEGNGGEETLAA